MYNNKGMYVCMYVNNLTLEINCRDNLTVKHNKLS